MNKSFWLIPLILFASCTDQSSENELWEALLASDSTEVLRLLTEEEADPNTENQNGDRPLHLAVQMGDLENVLNLINLGAEIDVTNNSGFTPYDLASEKGYDEMASFLSTSWEVREETDLDIWTAAKRGDLGTLSNLINSGAYDINELDDENRATPLYWAAYGGNLDTVKYLAENGGIIDWSAREGILPTHMAAKEGNLEVLKYFIEEIRYIRYSTDYDGMLPTHYAAWGGHLDVLKYLIEEEGMSVKDYDWNIRTPLTWAVIGGSLDCTKYLVEQGSYLKVEDEEENTLMHYAAEYGYPQIVSYLFDLGLSVTSKNIYGETPLHFACMNSTDNSFGSYEVVKFLVENGALVNSDDMYDRSPLYWAAYSGNLRIAKYLVENDAYIYNRATNDVSIVDIARTRNHQDIVDYILEEQEND